jgi:TolB-like protein
MPLLDLPEWVGRFVFLLLVIGFILALILSWAYELTPQGVKLEKNVDRSESITHITGRKIDFIIIGVLTVALLMFALDKFVWTESSAPVTTANADRRTIAVLPFINMSSDPEQEYFSDGLAEELLNLLARIPELRVTSRSSSFSYKGKDFKIADVGRELNVGHVLEGSVRRSGDQIRITAQLIEVSEDVHIWSETWNRTLDDIFVVQDEIAAAVVAALKVTLLGEAPHARVTDAHAYELYLQSKALANLSTRESLEEAALLLNDALAIDPDYAKAWNELGTVQINQAGHGYVPRKIGFERARISKERALQVEPNNARALSGLGWIAMRHEWDFSKAAQLLRKARELEPGNVGVLNAAATLAGTFGQHDQQISLLEAAIELDPFAMSALSNLTIAYLNAGRFNDAAERIDDMRAVEPNSFWVANGEAWLTWFRGDSEAALERFTDFGGSVGNWGRVFALHDLGRNDEIDEAIQVLLNTGGRPSQLAAIYAYVGDHDRAFAEFENAYEVRDDWLNEIRGFKFLESLYPDPRWEALLQKIGISDADAEQIGI